MLNSKHLKGRLVYEYDRGICINIFLKPEYDTNEDLYYRNNEDVYLGQVSLSLDRENFLFPYNSINSSDGTPFTYEDFLQEVKDGIKEYLNIPITPSN